MDHHDPDPDQPNESASPAWSPPSCAPSSDQRPAAGQGAGEAPASHSSFLGQLLNEFPGDSLMSEAGLGVRPAVDGWSEVYAPSWEELASRKLHAEVGGYDQEHDQKHAASTSSFGGQRRWVGDAASKKDEVLAETQSGQYWEFNVIDYEEKVVDGFYDAYGISTDSRLQGKMPSLTDLETDPGISGFGAIIVDRRIDHALEELRQIAHHIGLDCPATEVTILVQRLAELVTGHMGGRVEDANIMYARWVKRTTELRTSLQTNVLTIGSINVGLSRHRALLFKVLADSINLPCRLVKGGHYTGMQNDAVNLIKLDDEREYLVDLMAAPGTLIPAGFCSGKDDKPYKGEITKLPSFQAPNELEVVQSRPQQPSAGEQSNQSSVMETDSYVARKSSSKTSESFPSSPFACHDPGVGSSRVSGERAQQLNVNVVPQSKNSSEDPTNIFADLNPFATKVSGKAPMEGNSPGVKISEMPRQKNNPVPGQPRVQLMPKNRHPLNEVVRKKEYGLKEGLFPRSYWETNAYDVSSSIGSSTIDKVNPDRVSGGRAQQSNANAVLQYKNSSKHPINPFVDPYPFLMAGFPNALSNRTENKINEMPRQKNNSIPGQPHVPSMLTNRLSLNKVARKKEYGFKEGLFPRSKWETNAYDVSASIGSSTTGVNLDSFMICNYLNHSAQESSGVKVSNKSNQLIKESSHWNPVSENSPMLECSTGQYNKLPCEEHLNAQVREDPLRTQENLQHGVADSLSGCGSHKISFPDPKKCTNDRFMDTKVMLKDSEGPSSSIDSNTNKVDDADAGDEIQWEHLDIGERIGLGSYGEVYHADWNGKEVAVKKFLDQDLSGAALNKFRREMIRRLRHPNVVLFMGAVARPPNLSIIMEFLPRGSLYKIIHHPQCRIDEKLRIKMALDVARGMNCLHTSVPTIVHRDLKSPNLLVDLNWNVKVCDFGLSRLKHNAFLSSKSTAGTAEWMAPEVLRNEPSNEKCDIFSFGVILWELATLKIPWTGMNSMQVVGAVGFQNRRLEIPKEVDPLVGKIIWECWQTEPNLRPSFEELTIALKSLQRLVIPS
ncbi:serine/threonine-protein kinase EDR1 isoform X2 [Eucalyptus grandis]|uniref:serine/threonine-protein kinase EDR1 isoform X2 n=1 Tax=Eucalyptus grandis TaxID=71139 RepID=UPI00192ED73D|nr:serine/threonine-protein kinase EDR1 isoform X2 [Eucalyptus grandis]